VRGLVVVIVLAGAVAAALGAAGARSRRRSRPAVSRSIQTRSLTCRSPALGGGLPALVYLPPGYSSRGRRLPVVYFLHGLPATPQSYTQNEFVARSLVSAGQPAIVVAPQGAQTSGSDREYLDWSPTENWPLAITRDLPSCVDHRFHTIAGRRGRVLIGLSAGGYGALNIGLRNLQTFAAVESWSGYFAATDPSGYHVLKFPSAEAQRAATVPGGRALAHALARWPSLIGFLVGEADDRFADTNQAFDASLRKARIAHVFRTYPGGHSATLWQNEAPAWLSMALRYLATGRVSLRP
jgi:enterochelin esterase-like enzyme